MASKAYRAESHPQPTPAERRVLAAYDRFIDLLDRAPSVANRLSYALASITDEYVELSRRADEPIDDSGILSGYVQ